jgi:hypothetical protein
MLNSAQHVWPGLCGPVSVSRAAIEGAVFVALLPMSSVRGSRLSHVCVACWTHFSSHVFESLDWLVLEVLKLSPYACIRGAP